MRTLFLPTILLAVVMFVGAPWLIDNAPMESTMGFVQKIFYFHVPAWFVMFAAVFVCGIAGAIHVFRRSAAADLVAVTAAEIAAVFGIVGLVTGPLWARKAWGVWWQWDARLTSALILELILFAYLLLRRYGGPGSEKLASGVALFGMANVPFVYWSVNVWRTLHPKTTVVPSLGPGMRGAFWWCVLAFMLLGGALFAARLRLECLRARVDELYLEH
ncbi:MAG TPA: cytochrome c biogenesis protein CcsA [Vicinamibacterales bacterium]|jgi:heme exporter protein C|nr:cytochrome c biogenesis protein CcsA [Vicinamibacterales bacterium]